MTTERCHGPMAGQCHGDTATQRHGGTAARCYGPTAVQFHGATAALCTVVDQLYVTEGSQTRPPVCVEGRVVTEFLPAKLPDVTLEHPGIDQGTVTCSQHTGRGARMCRALVSRVGDHGLEPWSSQTNHYKNIYLSLPSQVFS